MTSPKPLAERALVVRAGLLDLADLIGESYPRLDPIGSEQDDPGMVTLALGVDTDLARLACVLLALDGGIRALLGRREIRAALATRPDEG